MEYLTKVKERTRRHKKEPEGFSGSEYYYTRGCFYFFMTTFLAAPFFFTTYTPDLLGASIFTPLRV